MAGPLLTGQPGEGGGRRGNGGGGGGRGLRRLQLCGPSVAGRRQGRIVVAGSGRGGGLCGVTVQLRDVAGVAGGDGVVIVSVG